MERNDMIVWVGAGSDVGDSDDLLPSGFWKDFRKWFPGVRDRRERPTNMHRTCPHLDRGLVWCMLLDLEGPRNHNGHVRGVLPRSDFLA